ncbi:MAG: N-acetylneuraminate synthase [Candidatus Omnitrophica bacterium]|nr:N-acetylneuraminate synthase [Candidatus Omnitrophota bacterium]
MLTLKHGRAFIIAEAGVNHNGDLKIAEQLVHAAKKAGADAVKFQTFKAAALASASARNVGYQQETVGAGAQVEMLRRLELDRKMHLRLIEVCHRAKIMFLSTPFDEQSADLLSELNVGAFKIPSGEITNTPFLKVVAAKKKPVILSTGMASLDEVRQAVRVLRSSGVKQLILLHCVTEYPAPFDQVNLRAMLTLGKVFNVPYGFSDHTPGVWMPIAAAALGAAVIEKHLTMSKVMAGPDHRASLEPEEFAELVRGVRAVESAMGDGVKRAAPCEKRYVSQVRKSLVAARDIACGEKIGKADLVIKRPGTGIPPAEMAAVIGRRARKSIKFDDLITRGMLA